jgi:hypothetical protein
MSITLLRQDGNLVGSISYDGHSFSGIIDISKERWYVNPQNGDLLHRDVGEMPPTGDWDEFYNETQAKNHASDVTSNDECGLYPYEPCDYELVALLEDLPNDLDSDDF